MERYFHKRKLTPEQDDSTNDKKTKLQVMEEDKKEEEEGKDGRRHEQPATTKKRITISIIGTGGRKSDKYKMNAPLYQKMIEKTKNIIIKTFKLTDWNQITLVSGASSFADHVAVSLYKDLKQQYPSLSLLLYLPCKWNITKFYDDKLTSKYNPGQYLNYLHGEFSKRVNIDSLLDLTQIQHTMNTNYKGFHARNLLVAKSDYLIAFAFSEKNKATMPKSDGGTYHTWSNSQTKDKVYIDLDEL